MIITPAQLSAVNELAATEHLDTIRLVPLPLCIEVTVTLKTGDFFSKILDRDGKERDTHYAIFGKPILR